MRGQEFLGLDGFALSVVGFIVGILGLAIAVAQLVRTQRAVVATRKAVERTERHLSVNQVLLLIPRLVQLEDALEDAVAKDDRAAAGKAISAWRAVVGEMRGLLQDDQRVTDTLMSALRESTSRGTQAKVRLSDQRSTVRTATEGARQSMSATVEEATMLAGTLKRYVEGKSS